MRTPTMRLVVRSLVSLAAIASLASGLPARAQSGSSVPAPERVTTQSNLNYDSVMRIMAEGDAAVAAQKFPVALDKYDLARKSFGALVQFHQGLAGSFSGIDVKIANDQRQRAAQAAQGRDQAGYKLALLYRRLNQPEVAIPLLVQVVQSQNPTTDLGKQAYAQLYELGFTSLPYPRSVDGTQPAPQQSPAPQTPPAQQPPAR
ncbi:hypothetical protein syc0358_d [Synechococcus elongatus PCC 6301]|uniref:Uncharacterized protein n=1 Tax=Synechococcus sp. (strain ATCC 27144 / PCC 6301 / SAUG 1402/1) TaxID=269084 RepID=A0A0H3K0I2_SYNP6|nr:hypothetical protein M744_10690 [Synechococcus elongatus UTEX 2973]BAD78548.1 hypothetical protein syc0358_d [Synechococcus elongatus PCC 6301]